MMQTFLKIVRWSVGLLFIFSGLIKANDPLGLSYKMQEFFDVWGMNFFSDYTLAFALVMNTLEIVAGIALLIQFPYKQTLWLLLGLIVFFTFLTGYAYFSGKIKTCGCFGDCIPLNPKTSFIKDVILLISIVILLFNQKKNKANIHKAVGIIVLILSILGIGYGQNYVLEHLPVMDCLPFKTGNDIVEKMKKPAGAIADSVSIIMEFEKAGKLYSFDANHFPDNFDSSYVYKNRKEIVVSKGNGIQAAIAEFALNTKNGQDSTDAIFSIPTPYVLVFAGKIESNFAWDSLLSTLHQKYKLVYVVTSDKTGASVISNKVSVLFADITMIKTAARVWPTIFVMNGSTIMQKKSYIDYLEK